MDKQKPEGGQARRNQRAGKQRREVGGGAGTRGGVGKQGGEVGREERWVGWVIQHHVQVWISGCAWALVLGGL